MPEPEIENPPLDCEDWNVVFLAYADYPILAFILAQHLNHLKELINHGCNVEAVAGLDRGIDSLMQYTTFRDVGRTVYHLAVAGKLRPDDEDTIREIGHRGR